MSSKREEGESDESESSEEIFEVEKIVGMKSEDGHMLYKVRWRGFSESEDTWEPFENLTESCHNLISEYKAEHGSEIIQNNETSPSSSRKRRIKRITKETPRWEYNVVELMTPEQWNPHGNMEIREIGNLYIPDHIPSETEKLLSTFQPDSIRVTRRKLQDMMKSDNLSKEFPKISEKKQNFYHEVLNQSKKDSSRKCVSVKRRKDVSKSAKSTRRKKAKTDGKGKTLALNEDVNPTDVVVLVESPDRSVKVDGGQKKRGRPKKTLASALIHSDKQIEVDNQELLQMEIQVDEMSENSVPTGSCEKSKKIYKSMHKQKIKKCGLNDESIQSGKEIQYKMAESLQQSELEKSLECDQTNTTIIPSHYEGEGLLASINSVQNSKFCDTSENRRKRSRKNRADSDSSKSKTAKKSLKIHLNYACTESKEDLPKHTTFQNQEAGLKTVCADSDEEDGILATDILLSETENLPLSFSTGSLDCIKISECRRQQMLRDKPLETFESFRSAALSGHLWAIRWTGRCVGDRRKFDFNREYGGKTVVTELCEISCNSSHSVDDMVRQLVQDGSNLRAVDRIGGRTPLHFAVSANLWCRIRTLLLLRSPVNIRDKSGKTPLDLLLKSRGPHYQVLKAIFLLLEFGADASNIANRYRNMIEKNSYISKIIEHDNKVNESFNEARVKVLIDITVRRTLTPVIVRPIWESEWTDFATEICFNYDPPILTSERFLYVILLGIFDYRSSYNWRVRMWGKSPFERVTMNDLPVQSLQGNPNGFVYATTVRNGWNKLKIKYHSFAMKKKYLLMAQILFVQLQKPIPT